MQRNNSTSDFAVINRSKFVEQNSIEDDSKSTPPTFNIKQVCEFNLSNSKFYHSITCIFLVWSGKTLVIVGPSFSRKDRTGNFHSTSSFHACTLGTWITDSRASSRIHSSLSSSLQLPNVFHISDFSF